MMRLLREFSKKLSTDRADSIFVPAMIMIPVVALCVGLAMEISKNSYIKSERLNAIQSAASSAVSLADSRGSLDWRVVDRIVDEYEFQRFGDKKFSRTPDSTLNNRITYDTSTRETANGNALGDSTIGSEGCLADDDGNSYPQYRISLEQRRGEENPSAPTIRFSRQQPTLASMNSASPLMNSDIYRVVRVEITDRTPNLVLGVAGMPCQKFVLSASAVTFAANSDLQ